MRLPLLRDRSDIGFALVGGGVAGERLESRSSRLGLDNVTFAPMQPFTGCPRSWPG